MTKREAAHFQRRHLNFAASKANPKVRYQKDVHAVWFAFRDRFTKPSTGLPIKYKLMGYELMCAVEEWAKKYPHDVRVTRCDDSHHMGSRLVLIEHRSVDKYMGTTVLVLTQCDAKPSEFFLYPEHREGLVEALVGVGRESKPIVRSQRLAEKAESAFWRKSKPGPKATVVLPV